MRDLTHTTGGRGATARPLAIVALIVLAAAVGFGPATPALGQTILVNTDKSDPTARPLSHPDSGTAIADRVEIARTDHGVPHIMADDLKSMGFAMAWVQSEDYGDQVAVGMVQRRGEYAWFVGSDAVSGDFTGRIIHARAEETFSQLDSRAQAVYAGFAEGINHFVRLNPDQMPSWMVPNFTAVDAHAVDVQTWSRADAAAFTRAELRRRSLIAREDDEPSAIELPTSWRKAEIDAAAGAAVEFEIEMDGSNAWALDGSRIESGHAVLLRNPHLSWDAGYYEAHVRVPEVIDFYGDFRIGGAFGIIGGFNEHLGWATTNNSPQYSQVYSLKKSATRPDYVLVDGREVPIESREVRVVYRNEDRTEGSASEPIRWTPWGPIVLEFDDEVFVLKDPRDGEFRRGEQFMRMMLTESLDEWLNVMTMRAHPSSNFTYADAAGNIALYYNARIPALPHESTGDTAAVVTSEADMWSELAPWESLPLYVNPPGGYVQQANDTPDYINLNVPLDRDTVAPNLPEPRLRLRSQLSLDLIHNDRVMTLEEVVELKHSPRMLAAERMLDDLLDALSATEPDPDLTEARRVLSAWDRTAAVDSRGGVLFKRWMTRYLEVTDTLVYREAWSPEAPAGTPSGVGSPGRAVAALKMSTEELRSENIPLDVPWGQLHRVVRGTVDEPVSGCEGGLGCFRTLSFAPTGDGRLAANRGDGWVFAVEFGEVPRGYSVLAYGQSRLENSPYFDDQAAMFARSEMKPIRWTDADIRAATIRRYRPGQERTEGTTGGNHE
jgi:acyl-homoserine-lactone acylase